MNSVNAVFILNADLVSLTHPSSSPLSHPLSIVGRLGGSAAPGCAAVAAVVALAGRLGTSALEWPVGRSCFAWVRSRLRLGAWPTGILEPYEARASSEYGAE